jgi:hypothetical protein
MTEAPNNLASRIGSGRAKIMRESYRSVLPFSLFCLCCHAVFGQALAPGFKFPVTVKPGDELTVSGNDLAGITAVTLKAAGNPDLAATGVRAAATSVAFTVPPAAHGVYTVVLSPGTIASIPLTVTPAPDPRANALSGSTVTNPPPGTGGSGGPGTITPPVTPAAKGEPPPIKIYMPDGQLSSHSIQVYVTRDILVGQNPRLRLLRSHAVTKKSEDEAKPEEPSIVAPGQEWVESIDGKQVGRSGTLLLFDLSQLDFDYKAMLRVRPVVSWADAGGERTAVGSREVNVGNIVAAIIWTASAVGVVVLIIILLSWRAGGNPLLLLTGAEGHISLAQTQIACWTVAVGGLVLGYGLIRLDIPNIPTSLLALMGASLATGGIGFFQDDKKQQAAVNAGVVPVKRGLALGDLVCVFPAGQAPELSLAKAQMLFWTVLLLLLFISKSILDGAIWDVPWALVALMGFSQAGYLAPKLTPQTTPTSPAAQVPVAPVAPAGLGPAAPAAPAAPAGAPPGP